ncbi:indolethylamine N-methyltransferase-like [Ixodes scapularis]
MDSQALRVAYEENFQARTYLDMYGRLNEDVETFQVEQLHLIFHSGLAQGKTLLEVGCGPMLWGSLLASSRFNHIVLSDLVQANRLEIIKWLNNNEDAFDWTIGAEKIAALEGYDDIKRGALEILERARSSVRKVVPCDVLEPGVLPKEHRETFDVVLSCNCLEAAAENHESFRRAVRNVGTLVKPGGLLVLGGIGGSKGYSVGTAAFPHANVTDNVVKQAVTDAGFQVKVLSAKNVEVDTERPEAFPFVLAARKP